MRLTLSLGVLTASNLVFQFLIQWYVLVNLGAGKETDALFASLTIPQFVLAVVSQSLMHVLVPILTGEDDTHFYQLVWGFIILIGGTFLVFAIVLFIAAPFWIPLLVPGFSESEQLLTVELVRIQVVTMVFTAISGVLWASYHARQKFLWADTTPLITSILGFAAIIFVLPRWGVVGVAWLTTIRIGIQMLLLFPIVKKFERPQWQNEIFRDTWRRLRPLIAGNLYLKTDPLVERYFASLVPRGGLSLFSLSRLIYSSSAQIANRSIAVPMVPILSLAAKIMIGMLFVKFIALN